MKSHEHNSNHEAPDSFTNLVRETVASEPLPPADPSLREALLKRLNQPVEPTFNLSAANRRRTFFQRVTVAVASTAALALVAFIWQRPALEAVIGLRHAPAAKATVSRPASDVDAETYESRLTIANSSAPQGSKTLGEPRGIVVLSDGSADYAPAPGEGIAAGGGGQGKRDGEATGDFPFTARVFTRPASTPVPPAAESAPQPGYTTPGPRDYYGNQPQGLLEGKNPVSGSGPAPGPAKGPDVNGPQSFNAPSREYAESNRQPQSGTAVPLPTVADPLAPRPVPATLELAPAVSDLNEIDEIKGIADVQLGKLAKDREAAVRAKAREVDQLAAVNGGAAPAGGAEARQKFDEVVRLTVELEKAKRSGVRDSRLEQEQLARLSEAIQQAREIEEKHRFALQQQPGGEQYAKIVENEFQSPNTPGHELSTFAIDVDTASYANVRRFLTSGQLPPPDAVRLEELVNYFKYKYPQPKGDDPFSVNLEMADCPWRPGHKLLRVGLQGKEIHRAERPASNIVFLIDTSGSMTDENKLPLLKQAFKMLTSELGENDKVTIVTYAGNAGLKLEPTRGDQKEKIIAAIESLQSGGSTHGSAGITLAYEQATATFIKGGTNKVILATDGDLNVGITDDAALVDLITKQKQSGVFLTVLGVGTGNLKDAKMERLANNGNGVYAYLDSVREARKVLVEEMSGSLVTIAQDVKIQVEFNPAQIHSYRLLGYENRVMANEQFRNDAKDAGEIGAGHCVTAMYEVVMAESDAAKPAASKTPAEEPLRYQKVPAAEKPAKELTEVAKSGELLMVRLRYKKPESTDADKATEREFPLKEKGGSFNSASADFQFASAAVAFGLSLRNSEFRGSANLSAVAEIATATLGEDVGGHRAEFLDLVRRAKTLRGE